MHFFSRKKTTELDCSSHLSTTAVGRGREPIKTTSVLHMEGGWPESVLDDDISKYLLTFVFVTLS
jgi:hypothetical protein